MSVEPLSHAFLPKSLYSRPCPLSQSPVLTRLMMGTSLEASHVPWGGSKTCCLLWPLLSAGLPLEGRMLTSQVDFHSRLEFKEVPVPEAPVPALTSQCFGRSSLSV